MSEIARDDTPRVVYFDETFNELDIVAREDVLWPCYSYKLALPVRSNIRLDTFEELVLNLAAQGMTDAGHIADFCYSDKNGAAEHPLKDVFFFVQSRLSGKGFLTDRFELGEAGKKLIEELKNETVEYKTAFVYQDRVSGGLLPCVNFDAAVYAEINAVDPHSIKFKTDITDRSSVTAHRIDGNERMRRPTDRDVERVFRQFKRRASRYGLLRNSGFSIPFVESFRSPMEEPESVYLYCRVLVQRGRVDTLLVSDGFGMGYSKSFTDHLNRQSWRWITGVKEKGAQNFVSDGGSRVIRSEKFSPIADNLKKARKNFEKWKDEPITSTNEGNKKKSDVFESIVALYAALEHTLAAVCFEYPVDDWIKVFSSGTCDSNARILRESAAKIGFSITPENSFLLKASPEAIRRARDGHAELQPQLILAVMAASHEKRHPFNRLVHQLSNEPTNEISKKSIDVFDFLARFKNLRDSFNHGNHPADISVDEFEELLSNSEKIIAILSPNGESARERNVVVDASPELSDYDQLCLKAEIALEKRFGLATLHFMNPDLKETLRRLEMPQYDSQIMAIDLASALQLTFNAVLSAMRSQASLTVEKIEKWAGEFERDLYATGKAVKEHAQEQAVRFALLAPGDTFPTPFALTRVARIKSAIQGGGSSLQAVCVALLAVSPDDVLASIARKTPEFLHTVDEAVKLRGHGNAPVLADETEIAKIKEKVFAVIQSLMEVVDD
jgi:hypothetical protein